MKFASLSLFFVIAIACNGQSKKQISSDDDWLKFREELQALFNSTFNFPMNIVGNFKLSGSDLPIQMEMGENSVNIAKDENTIREVGVSVPSLIYASVLKKYSNFNTITITYILKNGSEKKPVKCVYYLLENGEIKYFDDYNQQWKYFKLPVEQCCIK